MGTELELYECDCGSSMALRRECFIGVTALPLVEARRSSGLEIPTRNSNVAPHT